MNVSRVARTEENTLVRRMMRSILLSACAWLLVSSAHAQVTPNPSNYSRTSSFEYDTETGLLKSETVEPDDPQLCVRTEYSYDGFGNKTGATTSNCAQASGRALFDKRATGTTFAAHSVAVAGNGSVQVPAGAFPTTATNQLGQSETRSYDPRFGAPLAAVGPNRLTTMWLYDELGRAVKELRADGTSTLTHYCYLDGRGLTDLSSNSDCAPPGSAEIPAEAITYVETEQRDRAGNKSGPTARVYLDRAGRKLRTVTEAFDGSTQRGGAGRLIAQDTDYNFLGGVEVATDPYFLDTGASAAGGTEPVAMTSTLYDDVGRAFAVYRTDAKGSQANAPFATHGTRQASLTSFSYSALKTVTTDDAGHARIEERNIDGKVARMTDATGAQLAHFYDAFGNLVQTRDPFDNMVVVNYDRRGRKLSMTDPDTGTWEYEYDALGQLVWQRNPNQKAKSQETTLKYDLLGRMVERNEPEFKSRWYYDAYADGSVCDKGIGKLCESVTDHGVRRRIAYDAYARPIGTRTDIASGPSFVSGVSYDSATGRPLTQTYPSGVKVRYNYTKLGFVSSLSLVTPATVNPLPATAGATPGKAVSLPAGTMLWQGLSYNASGKVEEQQYGNGVTAKASFEPDSGRIAQITAGIGDATDIVNYSYQWNSLNQLTVRTDANGDGKTGAVTDTFALYDAVGRLQNYSVSAPAVQGLERSVTLQYNALGSVLYNSDVGIFTYPVKGAGRPHALQSVGGREPSSFFYDANGNMVTSSGGKYRSIAYTSFNLPDSNQGVAGAAGGPQYRWMYDEAHQRIRENRIDGSGTRVTWMMHPDAANGLSFEMEEAAGLTSNRHYLTAGGSVIGVLVSRGALPASPLAQLTPQELASVELVKLEYWHKDSLGSLVATTDHAGAVTGRYSYDPFGKRRTAAGNYDANGNLVYDWNGTSGGTDRGYTGHEHLDDVGIIHMNGRLFDPRLGVFIQGDPYIQDPMNLQNYNRYAYCYNSPLTCTDPTGQLHLFGHRVLPGLFNSKNLRIVAAIGVAWVLGPTSGIWGEQFGLLGGLGINNVVAQSAIAGFASGAIATGNLKGAVQGAFSGAIFAGVGNIGSGGSFLSPGENAVSWGSSVALHAVAGCVSSEVGGGKCGAGALSAAFSKSVESTAFMQRLSESGEILKSTLVSSVVGGTASVLGGGKFANGAQTAAFSHLFNHWAHNLELAVYGRDAHQALQDKMYDAGLVTESSSVIGGPRVKGRFDIANPDTFELWEIKRYSNAGVAAGELALRSYTDGTGFVRGGDLPGLRVGGTITLRGEHNNYTYFNAGNGLVVYSVDEARVRLRVPHPLPLPLPASTMPPEGVR
ncbi:RHS repeat-associated core domain-containing protein [Massilia sp. YMA4]|uniref:RHS repeat-associated core domain-containing protein n=1 Tax=Massilia sp. YMA4 TaxID=1593482 RepID=UPI001877BAEA|nr:RHS repeat-associated core domain-containing protein [Massilia sp. YMA4]